jgi:hypothetical protein
MILILLHSERFAAIYWDGNEISMPKNRTGINIL